MHVPLSPAECWKLRNKMIRVPRILGVVKHPQREATRIHGVLMMFAKGKRNNEDKATQRVTLLRAIEIMQAHKEQIAQNNFNQFWRG